MVEYGYALSSEEHPPRDLVRNARSAEQAGFRFALISDHYHPWVRRQGQSPFVWTVLGGIAQATETLRVGTGVTCPILRVHPVIIAQAAATTAAAMPGRFFLGVGTGERLNEHVLGQRWPSSEQRLAMLAEAVAILRSLWRGDSFSHHGRYYTVETARLFTLPPEPPPLMVAASGPEATCLAAEKGDGIIGLSPEKDFIDRFERAGGKDKPRYGQLTVCWAPTDEEARRTAFEYWPNSALEGNLFTELATPESYEQACRLAREEDVAKSIVCSSDAERHIEAIEEFVQAGYDHVYVHQVGPRQEDFLSFYETNVLPRLS